MNLRLLSVGVLVSIIGGVSKQVSAGAELFFDYSEWQSAMGATTTVDFTGLPSGMFLPSEQYADLGVLFTEGVYQVQSGGFGTYPQDGAGLLGLGPIQLQFTEPMYGIATHFPGNVIFELYDGDTLIYESDVFGIGGPNNFGGLISDVTFDRAILRRPGDLFVQIDNLYFGPPIPSPAALGALACGLFSRQRRRT